MAKAKQASANNTILQLPLSDLLLDERNPRFGGHTANGRDQADVLDYIVHTFGVDDVLSSLAINGYIAAEPLVCRRAQDSKKFIVAEGNRRLAACLIIAGDRRAARQTKRQEQYRSIWQQNGSKPLDPVPVIVFEGENPRGELLSYLGVRHIASAQSWDSFAKAAWVAKVIDENQMSLSDVATMIGDQHRTIRRLLEGYYFVEEAQKAGEFEPSNSQRKGRGSVTEYPFSWVYTTLGYKSVRDYLELDATDGDLRRPLISPRNISKTRVITQALFGDRSKGRSAAIEDSREISDLATVFGDPQKLAMLETGKTVSEIVRLTKPIDQRVTQGLIQITTSQQEIVSALAAELLEKTIADDLLPLSSKSQMLAENITKKLRDLASGDGNA